MGEIKSYQDLLIWQKGKEITLKVYHLTNSFPKEELYALTSQIRRCSVSIPSNIAEGWGRGTDKNIINFLSISKGSLYELETQLIIAFDLKYINETQLNEILILINEVSKMIVSLIGKIKLRNGE
jgi:four helix bundle protein